MPDSITSEHSLLNACVRCGFIEFYTTLIFFSLHWAMVLYINSSYLEQFFDQQTISTLYIIGSLLTLTGLVITPALLRRVGTVPFIVLLTVIECAALIGMAFVSLPALVIVCFVAHFAVTPLILFSLDTLMEGLIGDNEASTGGKRGLFLTVGALALAAAALGMGFLVGDGEPQFARAYLASTLLLIPFLLLLLRNFGKYQETPTPTLHDAHDLKKLWSNPNLRKVYGAYFLLQLFFAWMVIYTPAYLANVVGYSWEQVGIILFSGLMAFVLLQYLIGYIADTYIGEKEMMAAGFAVMALAVCCFPFINEYSIAAWMVIMFLTRVGAALTETTAESYFFKHTRAQDARLVGIFRIAQPLGFIVGPALGGILLLHLPFMYIFVVLAVLMIPGIFLALGLHDTR